MPGKTNYAQQADVEFERVRREKEQRAITKSLSGWREQARPNQLTPPGNWRTWMMLAGRGFGKTRAGAEDVKEYGLLHPKSRIAIVAPTFADARDTCVEGESGLYNCLPEQSIKDWNRSIGELVLYNGTRYKLFSAEKPNRLRGPQHHRAWCEELAAWQYEEAWDQLQFGLRLGDDPQTVVTTTPKPVKLVRDILSDPTTHKTTGSTFENAANLPKAFLDRLLKKYEGTRLGRQEIYAEVLDDTPGALWKLAAIEILRVKNYPPLVRIVVGVDPEASSEEGSAETGIIVVGMGRDGHLYVLFDASIQGTPNEWGMAVVAAYMLYQADCIVVEVNNGGDMCEATIRQVRDKDDKPVGKNLPVKKVHASRGKYTRAEPISSIYEQGRAHHVGYFGMLESQMCSWVPGTNADSPDRMDALVWACTELTGGEERKPLVQQNYLDGRGGDEDYENDF